MAQRVVRRVGGLLLGQREATRYTDAWTTFLIQRKGWAYRQAQLSSTHPIAADMVDLEAVEVNFDGITYAQGASSLRQLVAWVGEKEFLDGLTAYFDKHAWGNTRLGRPARRARALQRPRPLGLGRRVARDLRCQPAAPGRRDRRRRRLHQRRGRAGAAVVAPGRARGAAPAPHRDRSLRPHRARPRAHPAHRGRRRRRAHRDRRARRCRAARPAAAQRRRPHLRQDPARRPVAAHRGRVARPSSTRPWPARSSGRRRGTCCATPRCRWRDFLALVEAGLPAETDISVVTTLLNQTKAAIEQFSGLGKREGYRDRWSALVLRLTADAAPGSDDRSWRTPVPTPPPPALPSRPTSCARWLSGDAPEGLVVDTDLRWSLLQRLARARCGRPGRDRRRARARRHRHRTPPGGHGSRAHPDHRGQGGGVRLRGRDRRPAQRAPRGDRRGLRARPTSASCTARSSTATSTPCRTCGQTRTNETAQTIVMGLYPAQIVEQGTLDLTDRFLARDDVPAGARRLVREGRDGVERVRCAARPATVAPGRC